MKRASVEAMMHDLKGPHFYKSAEGVGRTWPIAVYRAIQALSKQKGVKKKHINTFNLTVSINTVPNDKDDSV